MPKGSENMVVRRSPKSPRVIVKVTPDIIRQSVTADSSHCMIAEALRTAVPTAHQIAVDVQTIRFSDPKRRLRYVYLTPRIAQVPLLQFDQGILPEPFEFWLRGAQVVRMATPRGAKKIPSTVSISSKAKKTLERAHKAHQALAQARLVNRNKAIETS